MRTLGTTKPAAVRQQLHTGDEVRVLTKTERLLSGNVITTTNEHLVIQGTDKKYRIAWNAIESIEVKGIDQLKTLGAVGAGAAGLYVLALVAVAASVALFKALLIPDD